MIRTALLAAYLCVGQLELADVALRDLAQVPAELRYSVRYLEQSELPEAERALAVKVLTGHVNGLSRETDLTPLYVVPGTKLALLRLTLDDYRWQAGVWEQLAGADPYDHVSLEAVAEPAVLLPLVWRTFSDNAGQLFLFHGADLVGGFDRAAGQYRPFFGGKWGKATAPPIPIDQAPPTPAVRQRALTDRLGKGVLALAAQTGSQAPIVKAAWFFNQTAAQEARTPGYYDFLGIKDEKAFQDLVGFDAKKTRRKTELREAVADSGVSPAAVRAIVRETAEDGGYWKTFDFRRGLDKVNPLRVLGRDIDDQFAAATTADVATEQMGPLPNDLWAWYLGDNKGKRQATAPDFAASDHSSRSNDKRVHANVSCVRCHAIAGMQDIDAWVRNLVAPPLALASPEYVRLRQLRQQYLRRLTPFLANDRTRYTAAVFAATGLDVKEFQAAYARYWERYEDAKVDAVWAARDLGVEPMELVARLDGYLKASGSLDPVLSVFLLPVQRRRTIGIRQWEEAFPLARQILKGTKP